jgi:fibulin 1/2
MIENECLPGFTQDPNGAEECVDINECKTGTHSCNLTTHECINSNGSFSCVSKVRSRASSESCRSGFRRNRLSNECEDVNECETIYGLCLIGQTCQNTIGSYVCNCQVYCQLVLKFFIPIHSLKIFFSMKFICNKIINRLVIRKIP